MFTLFKLIITSKAKGTVLTVKIVMALADAIKSVNSQPTLKLLKEKTFLGFHYT